MKKLFTLFFVCLEFTSFSQNVDKALFRKLLEKEFVKLYSPDLKNGLGNYGSFSVLESKLTFSGNLIVDSIGFGKKKIEAGGVLALNVSGGITDGIVGLFQNNRWNKNLGLDIQYNFFRFNKWTIAGNKKLNYITIDANQYDEFIKNKNQLIQQYNSQEYPTLEDKFRALSKRNDSIRKMTERLRPTGFQVLWVSLGAGIYNNSFRHYDPTQSFDSQISSTSFLRQDYRLQLNFIRKGQYERTLFASLFVKGSITDNFDDLTKHDFEEKSVDTLTGTERINVKKYSGYSGNYQKNIQQLTLGLDFYGFLDKRSIAVHLFPNYIITKGKQPETNLGMGILIPFINKKDNDILNFEVFMNARNLFETNGTTETNIFRRSTYGIRFTVPISLY